MRLKSLTAGSMKEAMQLVRDTLGEDAIIIATREEAGGVRVTAAIESDLDSRAASVAAGSGVSGWFAGETEEDEPQSAVEDVTDILLRHAVPDDLTDQIIGSVSASELDEARFALFHALGTLFRFEGSAAHAEGKALMLVGPPGAGKTLATAKIATRASLENKPVHVITADTVRAGGVEQLEAFMRLLDIALVRVETPADLKRALADAPKDAQILIDTAGLSPFDTDQVRLLARLIGAGEIEPMMVLPAGCDADEAGEMARVFATLGAERIMPTRLDAARRLGAPLAAAWTGKLAFADYANSPLVTGGIGAMSAKKLTQFLMPAAAASRNETTEHNTRKTG